MRVNKLENSPNLYTIMEYEQVIPGVFSKKHLSPVWFHVTKPMKFISLKQNKKHLLMSMRRQPFLLNSSKTLSGGPHRVASNKMWWPCTTSNILLYHTNHAIYPLIALIPHQVKTKHMMTVKVWISRSWLAKIFTILFHRLLRRFFSVWEDTSNTRDLKFVKNTPTRAVISTPISVFGYPDKTLSLVFDILVRFRFDFLYHYRYLFPFF